MNLLPTNKLGGLSIPSSLQDMDIVFVPEGQNDNSSEIYFREKRKPKIETMSSFIRVHIHYVFSTKNHEPFIVPKLEERLWPYMGAIARDNNMKVMMINGTEDHAHVLMSLPSTITIAKAIQLVKGGSSHWVHQTFPELHDFEWQKGYGAFSVSHFDLDRIINYIKNQKKHHFNQDSKTEFLDLLNKHQVDYNIKYIWE